MKFRYLLGYSTPFLMLNRKIFEVSTALSKASIRILTYHDISIAKLQNFKRQIKYLSDNYQFITPYQLDDFFYGESSFEGMKLLLTFDDGFASHRLVAEEILKPFGIKGIFFVPTNFIGLVDKMDQKKFIEKKIFNNGILHPDVSPDMAPLTWKDLTYILNNGHAIGSHTYTHSRLTDIRSTLDLEKEINESGNVLTERLGVSINYFSYPFGDIESINKASMRLIRKKYKYCFSGIRGVNNKNNSPYALCRDALSVDFPLNYLRFILESGLDFYYKQRLTRLRDICLK